MKNLIVLKIITAVLAIAIIFTLFSCINEDRIEVLPVKQEYMNGSYKARLIMLQGDLRSEKVIDFKVKKDTIQFADFPVGQIIKLVLKDPVKTETAITAMGKVKYNLKYASVLNADKNWLELSFSPKELELQIPVDGTVKKAVVTCTAKQTGYFVGLDHSLRFALVADKITVDGTVLAPFEPISYNFPYCLKNY